MTKPLTPTLLLILDGWGIAPAGPSNATSMAATPHMDALLAQCPHSELAASGRAVGLPSGYIGNSEVGHLNIGAGRVVYQDMTRIDVAMEKGELDSNPVFQNLLAHVRSSKGRLHLMGLLSDGGVHSHIEHLKALARAGTAGGVEVLIHCFMDGRDTTPHGGVDYVHDLQTALDSLNASSTPKQGKARVASLCGRFYAMDRDNRWERVHEAWNLLAHGKGVEVTDAGQALRASYAAGVTDEFVRPTVVVGPEGTKDSPLRDGDGLFLFNFRADRMRELVQALTVPHFDSFERGTLPRLAGLASMTAYDATFTLPVAFPKEPLHDGLGEVLANLGYKQLRLAETEKYAHVTYFFNGGQEQALPGEDRIMVPSRRDVLTYDLAPAMSCEEVTDKCIEAWNSGQYTLIVCNLANGDMVGHTGVMSAAVTACETVDHCVGRMVEAVRASHEGQGRGGRLLIIADHGNCESMLNEKGEPQTAHTTNPVPCILVQEECRVLHTGKLADVAPTLLALWGLDKPASMDGNTLVEQCR